ncbi:MAG: helix-turn-helix transcriptional regulator, partial [Kiritimatiellae bacterium]|nr:helix-turn-helix transcriptional regulator [Kiritimatiellia bacterium]
PALSKRQIDILNLVAKGLSNKEIARIVGLSPDTVKYHVAKILQIIGSSTRAEATSIAINLGLITG